MNTPIRYSAEQQSQFKLATRLMHKASQLATEDCGGNSATFSKYMPKATESYLQDSDTVDLVRQFDSFYANGWFKMVLVGTLPMKPDSVVYLATIANHPMHGGVEYEGYFIYIKRLL